MIKIFPAFLLFLRAWSLKTIENGLAKPEIIVSPIDTVFEPKCEVTGNKLDLLFVLDSSGSLKDKFHEVTGVIQKILDIVAVGPDAARVALINYSGVQRTEFHFNTFTRKKNIIQALDTLRSLKGITKTGAALEYAMQELDPAFGMRGNEVPKIVFLLSDGRTHDWPKDEEMARRLRNMFPVGVLDIWAYGTGQYVAFPSLVNVTLSRDKIVSNPDLNRIHDMFADFKGVEICEPVPSCVPGSDKPLDLILILDSSSSLDNRFEEQVNFIRRIVAPMNVHQDAVRLALITFSTTAKLEFDFKRFHNTADAIDFFTNLSARKGTTNTRLALRKARDMFANPWVYGGREEEEGVPRMIVILTDGHSRTAPRSVVSELWRLMRVSLWVVSVNSELEIDYNELLELSGGVRERVFTPSNLGFFENNFHIQHVGFGCPGMEGFSTDDFVKGVRGSVKVRCRRNVVELTVRTMRNFAGWLYVKDNFHQSACVARGDDSREVKLTIMSNQCGVKAVPFQDADGKSGYRFNYTAMIQFHPEIITRVDQGLEVECEHEAFVSDNQIKAMNNQLGLGPLQETQCKYELRKFGADCVALDARVGELLNHRWSCDNQNYAILVHDCFVESDEKTLEILDSNGCSVDPYIMETPKYIRGGNFFYYVSAKRDMSVWKFPTAHTLRFRCKISLCDMESVAGCKYQLNPQCPDSDLNEIGRKRVRRNAVPHGTKPGFHRTVDVETRRLNVLENEALKPESHIDYCTSFNY